LAGAIACAVFSFSAPALCPAETNVLNNSAARYHDDKSAVVNLAIQAVQQIQAQQQISLSATTEVTKSVASLRRLTLLMGTVLAAGMLALLFHERRLIRSLQHRLLMATALLAPNSVQRATPEAASLVLQLLARGQALLNHKEAAAALACFDEAITLEVNNADVHVKRGFALQQLGRLEEALVCFDHALALNAFLADAYVGKGEVLNRLERYREALDCYEQASHLRPVAGGATIALADDSQVTRG
jgi:tetratricopeptide (TPR) repeat protein